MILAALVASTVAKAASLGTFPWADTPETSELYQVISEKDHRRLEFMLAHDAQLGKRRSADGRGGAWWAFEHANARALALLAAEGVEVFEFDRDSSGKFPKEMCAPPKCDFQNLQKQTAAGIPDAKKRLAEVRALVNSVEEEEEEEEEEIDSYRLNEVLNSKLGGNDDDIDEEL